MFDPLMNYEKVNQRFDIGYNDGLQGSLPVEERDWHKPEYHEAYMKGYTLGKEKLEEYIARYQFNFGAKK